MFSSLTHFKRFNYFVVLGRPVQTCLTFTLTLPLADIFPLNENVNSNSLKLSLNVTVANQFTVKLQPSARVVIFDLRNVLRIHCNCIRNHLEWFLF
jgi:hypothetical protein